MTKTKGKRQKGGEEKMFLSYNYILFLNFHKHTAQEPQHINLKACAIFD